MQRFFNFEQQFLKHKAFAFPFALHKPIHMVLHNKTEGCLLSVSFSLSNNMDLSPKWKSAHKKKQAKTTFQAQTRKHHIGSFLEP